MEAVRYIDGRLCCLLHVCRQALAPSSVAGKLQHLVIFLVFLGVHEFVWDASQTSTCSTLWSHKSTDTKMNAQHHHRRQARKLLALLE